MNRGLQIDPVISDQYWSMLLPAIGPKNPDLSLNVTCKFVHVCVFVPECVCVSMGQSRCCLDGTVVN